MDKPLWMWAIFAAVVIFLLVLDLGVLHRKQREIEVRESLFMSAFYIFFGLLFGGWVYESLGAQAASEYFTGFLVEKSLSLDNIFVISLIFTYFGIPRQHQHRVLFWGILGALLLRGIMIGIGAELVSNFHWVLYIFAAFLIYTGLKMLKPSHDSAPDISQNKMLRFVNKIMRTTDKLHGNKFFIRDVDSRNPNLKVIVATPLFVALVLVECADVVFAVDSVPAIFAITTDPYIVYTSNIFAILGLRALYFALAAVLHRFAYLEYALALVLIFIGSKIFMVDFMGLEKFPAWISLTVTIGLLAGGIVISLIKTKKA